MAYFPDRPYSAAGAYCDDYFAALAEAAASVDRGAITAAAELLDKALHRGATIFACGNGGSAAIANHLVCDCLKGLRSDTELRPKVHSLSCNIELLTAIANDLAYEQVFAYQLASLAKPGDLLITISSSGTSPNIVAALKTAREQGLSSIAMSGFTGGASRELADVCLHVQATNYGLIEDTHQALMHLLAQFLRQRHITSPDLLGIRKF